MTERKRVIQKLYDAKVRYIFAGHYHRNAYGEYKELQMITSSAIGAQSPDGANADYGYRVVEVSQDKIQHHYHNITRSNGANISKRSSLPWILGLLGLFVFLAFLAMMQFYVRIYYRKNRSGEVP